MTPPKYQRVFSAAVVVIQWDSRYVVELTLSFLSVGLNKEFGSESEKAKKIKPFDRLSTALC